VKYQINQEDSLAIKDKLKAEVVPKKDHDFVRFSHEGKLIFWFGVRRGSRALPHPHVSRQMFLSQKECRLFRECTISVEEYIQILRSKGKI
jgi:hypothetical protein